jgi:hypothetical protein
MNTLVACEHRAVGSSAMDRAAVSCEFGAVVAPFNVYLGDPAPGEHPMRQQAAWLLRERGGVVPDRVLDAFTTEALQVMRGVAATYDRPMADVLRLRTIALENDVDFMELVRYDLGG